MATLSLFPSRIRFTNADGTLTTEAARFLQVVVGRVGGTLVGMDSPYLVTVTASPFLYESSGDGYLVIVGGTVTKIEHGRQTRLTEVSTLNGLFPVTGGDSYTVSYSDAPTMTFIPR